MRKHKGSSSLLATEKQNLIFGGRQRHRDTNDNKRGNGAKDCSLRSLAPRPRLFCAARKKCQAELIGAYLLQPNSLTKLATLGIVAIGMIVGAGLINSNANAVSATLSVPDSVSVNANPSVNNGFAESSNDAISVSTGNQMGYTLTIKAKDNNQLKNGSNVLNSISTNLTADQYKNGDYVNTWGMKPSSINSSSNTSYVPGPTTSGITIAQTNMNSTTAENYSLGIAAKVDSNTVAGNYGNTFVLTATANDAHYNITFNKNGGSGGPSSTQTGSIGSSTYVNIAAGTPTYSNKEFLGWCTENPGTGETCNGALIQPGGKFPLCKCDLNITLHAMYGKKDDGSDFSGKMDGETCTYTGGYVGKAYGGKCWMWQDYQAGSTKSWTRNKALTTCPTGWHLPSRTEFQTLLDHIGSDSQLYQAGWTSISYWSSTGSSSSNAYILFVSSSSANVNTYSRGSEGDTRSVRCVAG